jgi:radical SAM superfamily enzyme YgiQ (UPF0313 family)
MRVLLVYPEFPDTFWSFKHALRFIEKKASSPPLGLVTIAAMLPPDWEKRLVDLNVSPLLPSDLDWADLVLISAMLVQRASAIQVIDRACAAGKRIIAGGPLFTAEYENFPMVDHLVLNEAELTLPAFLADFSNGNAQHLYTTEQYPELCRTPVPMWELVDLQQYDSLSIQFSRGCPFNCDFCNVTALFGHRPRVKSAEQIIAELDKMVSLGWKRNIFFVDDNFIGNKRVLKESILPALMEWRKDKTGCRFITEASINLADDPELMDMMVQAGFISVFVGIETPDEESLAECNKVQNKNRNLIESVRRLQRGGLQVMGGFIVGFDSDTATIFQRQIDFIQNSGIVTAMVGLLQAPYGTILYRRLQSEGRVIHGMSGDNADGLTNIIPKMPIAELQRGYTKIIREIYTPKQFYQRVKNCLTEYRPAAAPVHLQLHEILAFFRSIYWLGIRGGERVEYWKLFFWALFQQPRKFSLAITFSIYGYHFWQVFQQHIAPNAAPVE